MKTAQWVGAVVILALMVFALTFAMNYLGNSSSGTSKPPKDMLRLTFPVSIYPEKDLPPMLSEHNQGASCDFWFVNKNDQDVKVGLVGKSCKCARVELFVLSENRQKSLPYQIASRVGMLAAWPLAAQPVPSVPIPMGLLPLATWHETEGARQMQANAADGTTLKTDAPPAKVPANAIGWVRLTWDTNKADERVLGVELWTDDLSNLITAHLETRVHILDPLLAPTDADLGTMALRDLPKTIPVYCYSCTRDTLRVQAEIDHEGRSEAADPFKIGQPVRMSDTECIELQHKANLPYIRAAWRIDVTVLPTSPDGSTPIEYGRFRRFLTVRSPDEGVAPQKTMVSGTVTGPVTVGSREDDGSMVFGVFPSRLGFRQQITLQSDEPGLELEVDFKRTPDFLEVKPLEEPHVSPTGHRTWVLKARVLPGKVTGTLPNPADPAFRDSAIYIKTKGDKPRTIRIPVRGSATEG
jgi:hypothetical protein